MNEHIEKMVEEFDSKWYTDALGHNDHGCDGADECCGNCGGWVADSDSIKSFLRTALISAYNAGLEKAIVLASTTTWDNMRLDSAGYMIGMSDARICITAAIEKEKLVGKQSPQ